MEEIPMLHLKNTLLTLSIAITSIAAANQEFTPQLIVKNTSQETLFFAAPDKTILQLLQQENGKNFLAYLGCPQCLQHLPEPLPCDWNIQLNPHETLTLKTIPTYLTNWSCPDSFFRQAYTCFLSPKEYSKHNKHYVIDSAPNVETKPFVSQEEFTEAQKLKKDIMISIAKSEYKQGSSVLYPCTKDELYLEIIKTELVDRA